MFKWIKSIKWPSLPEPSPSVVFASIFLTLTSASFVFLLGKVEADRVEIKSLNYQVELLKERGHEENTVIQSIIRVEEALADNAESLNQRVVDLENAIRQKPVVTKDICVQNRDRLQKIHTSKTIIDRYYGDCIKHVGG